MLISDLKGKIYINHKCFLFEQFLLSNEKLQKTMYCGLQL